MKKNLTFIFTVAFMLSLTACGGEVSPEITAKDTLAGSYVSVGLVLEADYELNENGSYNHGDEKGTYTLAEDDSLILQPKDGNSNTLTACGEYYHTDTQMAEDTEYGLAPSFDENGHSNQTFITKENDISLTLELHEDGSYMFSYSKASPVFDEFSDVVTYEGSYVLEDAVLNLNYNDNSYTFLFKDNIIYPTVYVKQSDTNSADIEAARAALLTAEKKAAQGRWWTPADETTAADVTMALAGTWEYSDGFSTYRLVFSETGVSVYMEFMGTSYVDSSGTYSIQNGAILLDYETYSSYGTIHNHMAVPYTYADGNLVLYEMLDMLNEDGLLDAEADLTEISTYQYQKIN